MAKEVYGPESKREVPGQFRNEFPGAALGRVGEPLRVTFGSSYYATTSDGYSRNCSTHHHCRPGSGPAPPRRKLTAGLWPRLTSKLTLLTPFIQRHGDAP
jgi:hypothetical protein